MLLEIAGVGALIFGLFFCAVGVIGVIRMPDNLTRLHASGKVATLGLFGLLAGAAILMPSISFKVLALGLFVLFTSPVATHAIAAADYRRTEIVEELIEMETPEEDEIDMTAIDITGFLSRQKIQEIIEAQQLRALQASTGEREDNGRDK